MKVMLSAGEASGDLHGSHLIGALRELRPNASFFGMGGKGMAAKGMEVLFDPTSLGAFGLIEIVRYIPLARQIRHMLIKEMETRKPDVLVLIDYPGFNMRLAAEAKARNIKCVYYFSPSAWAWGKGRAKKIAKTVTRVASVFPFEEKVYREAGADVVFVGHPLKDLAKAHSVSPMTLREDLLIPDGTTIVALCPGSRSKEISSLYEPMLGAARAIMARHPDIRFVCPVAPTVSVDELKSISSNAGIDVAYYSGDINDIYAISNVAIIASGTATLEAALAGVPMVIVYKIAGLTYHVFKRLVSIDHIGLPNIVAGREVVPELLQDAVNPVRIASEVLDILEKPGRAVQMKNDLSTVSKLLGEPGAIRRAAQVVVGVAEGV